MKRKLFSLMTLLLCAVTGAWADAEIIFDPSASGWSGVTLTSGTTTVADVTWYGRNNAVIETQSRTIDGETWTAYLKTAGASTFKSGSDYAGVLTYTPSTAGTIKVYTRGGGKNERYLYITQSAPTSTDRDESIALGSVKGGDGTSQLDGVASAEVEAGQEVVIYVTNSMLIYGITFESSVPKTGTTVHEASNQIFYACQGTVESLTEKVDEINFAGVMTFAGINIQKGSTKFTIDGGSYTSFKVARGSTYVITPATGMNITSVTLYALANHASNTCTITTGEGDTETGVNSQTSSPTAITLTKNGEGKFYFTVSSESAHSQAIIVMKVTYAMPENVDVKVSSAGYATLYYGSNLTIPEGVEVYVGQVNGSKFKLKQVTGVIPAETGVILKASAGTYNFIVTTDEADTYTNDLMGTTTEITTPSDAYTLGQDSEGEVGLRQYSGASIRAYSAYLPAAKVPQGRALTLEFDETTGVKALDKLTVSRLDNSVYDLSGRKIVNGKSVNGKLQRGLYIVNGKKVVVK